MLNKMICLLLMIMLTLLDRVQAEPVNYTKIKVGYMENTGFLEEDWNGHYRGYGYEYMESLSNYGNWQFEYIPFRSWKKMGEALKSGEIDTMPSMPGNYKVFDDVKRTDHVIGRYPMELVLGYEGLKPNMLIGNLITNNEVPSFSMIAEEEGFNYEFKMYDNFWDMKYALKRGEIDGYIDAMVTSKTIPIPFAIFDRQSYRLLFKDSNVELLKQFNMAMDQMLLYQPDIRDRLAKKYSYRFNFPLSLSLREREYLEEHKKLKAAILINQKPTAYIEEGEYKGAIIEIINKIADDLRVEIEFVGVETQDEAAGLIRSGQADFIADALCDYSWASEEDINLTQPYMDVEYVAVQRQNYVSKSRPVVAACENFLYTKSHIEKYFSADKIRYVPTIEEGFKSVSRGQADLIFIRKNQAIYYIEETETYNLVSSPEEYFSDSICFGVNKGSDQRLWHILNKEVNHIDKSFVNGAINRNQSLNIRFTPKWMVYHYPVEVIIGIFFIMLIIVGIILYRNKLRKENLETIKHMAYTDLRYDLPNLSWLESEMPEFLTRIKKEEPLKKIYVAIFALESKSALVTQYGEELLINYMRETSKQLENKRWIEMTATGMSSSKLILICKATGDSQIIDYMTEVLEEHSYIETQNSRIKLHMRSGICEYKSEDSSLRQVVERANVACFESSIYDVQVFNEKMQEDIKLNQDIEGHMEQALVNGEFKAWYQPKYDIKTRRVIGAEALVRWISPELGFMPPGKFIPLFEQNGFVIPVDYSILEQVFQFQKQRINEGKEVVPISVNQSRLHMTEEGYLDKIKAIIDKYELSPKGLIELEVTETVFGDFDQETNQDKAANIIGKLHEMGFTISVDDFGSGYSSFMLLNYLPMDVMKIDRTLLETSGDSKRMKNILANVINLGRSLNMQVICEGIETTEQEKLLLELGCHYGQGFLNSKPLPVEEFIKFFEKRNLKSA